MKSVYKYPITLESLVIIRLPVGAQILRVDMQGYQLCLWALVDPEAYKEEERVLKIVGTGTPILEQQTKHYLGTFFMYGGQLVYHVFDVSEAN